MYLSQQLKMPYFRETTRRCNWIWFFMIFSPIYHLSSSSIVHSSNITWDGEQLPTECCHWRDAALHWQQTAQDQPALMSCEAEWLKLEVPATLYTQHSWSGSWPITVLGGNKLFSIRKTNSTLAEVIKLSSTGTARPINDIEKWICFTYGTGLVGPIYDKVCCTKANPGWFTLTYNMPLQPIHTGWTANHTTYQDIWIEVVQTLWNEIPSRDLGINVTIHTTN